MKTKRYILPACLLLLATVGDAGQPRLDVGLFSAAGLAHWQEKSFAGHTRYTLYKSEVGQVVQADSRAMASGMFREVEIDLRKTPVLNWRWRVSNTLQGVNERSKPGDDYPARIYVVFSGGLFFWKTRALNYVWSSNQPVGSDWPNAFTGNAHMIAVETGRNKLGQWLSYQRNIREDYRRYFGKDVEQAHAVAIMTDTDNSRQQAQAFYGDIFFTAVESLRP